MYTIPFESTATETGVDGCEVGIETCTPTKVTVKPPACAGGSASRDKPRTITNVNQRAATARWRIVANAVAVREVAVRARAGSSNGGMEDSLLNGYTNGAGVRALDLGLFLLSHRHFSTKVPIRKG